MEKYFPLWIENLTDGQLINRHGELLYIVIEEDWIDESKIECLEQLGAELRRRNDLE